MRAVDTGLLHLAQHRVRDLAETRLRLIHGQEVCQRRQLYERDHEICVVIRTVFVRRPDVIEHGDGACIP